MIDRKKYINSLEKFRNKKIIKVLTGIRRSGKSTIFLLFMEHLKKIGIKDENIIYLNLEDLENIELLDYLSLYNFVKTKIENTNSIEEKFYLFIDEIQLCANFEKALNSFFLKENLDIYVTGSNAYFLSGELATLLSGRYVQIHVQPLSFSEYLDFFNENQNLDKKELFSEYLKKGQFPYIPFIKNEPEVLKSYIEGIFNTILIKDVSVRSKINEISLLQKIIKTICSNIGSPISSKRITDTLISSGRKISGNTVENYIKALCDAFIFYEVPRFDVKGNQILKTLGKYYLSDTSFRNILIGTKTDDFGHLLENIVYLELLRRNNQVFVGKVGDNEVDFVCKNEDKIEYYQVSATILDETTRNREFKPLESIKDNFPKYILTLDDFDFSKNGIICKNLIQWLLQL